MAGKRAAPRDIDDYISRFPPEVRLILERIRSTIRRAAPGAREPIPYALIGRIVKLRARLDRKEST